MTAAGRAAVFRVALVAGVVAVGALCASVAQPLDGSPAVAGYTLQSSAAEAGATGQGTVDTVAVARVDEPPCVPAPIERRAATVLMAGMLEVTSDDDPLAVELADLGLGGVLLGDGNVRSREQVTALVEGLRSRSSSGLLVAIDEEGGRVSTSDALGPRGPSARRLGLDGPDAAREVARFLGQSLSVLGVDVVLSPVADVDGGPAGRVIGDRAFAGTPDAVVSPAVAFAEGLGAAGVAATAKHFPGHGRAADSHDGSVRVEVGVDELRSADLVPFRALVDAGVPLVMMAHVTYSGLGDLPATLSPAAYDLLRETGFEGVAMTDAIGMGAIVHRYPVLEATWRSVAAGADLVLTTDGRAARAMRDELVAAVFTGQLAESRLDEAVTRVLTLRGEDPATMVCPSP